MTDNTRADRLEQAFAEHRAGRLAEAAAIYRELVTADPGYLPGVHGLGLVTHDLGAPDAALPLLARCVAEDPNNAAYRCSLGMVSLALGRAEAAAVALLPAANATPPRLDARLLLIRALGAIGRWEEAHKIAADTSAAFPDSADIWSSRARAAGQLGQLDDAEAAWREAVRRAPNDPEILNNLGVLLRRCGRLKEAVEVYRTAITHAPNHAVCHSNLGNVLGQLGDEMAAELHLRRAVTLDPSYVHGLYNLGAHLVRTDQPDAAVPLLQRVLAEDPTRWDALTNLGVALVALGELGDAEDCYRRALTLKPDNPEAHYDLAWLLLLTGRWTEGWAEYEWRWQMPRFSSRRRSFDAPAWDGAELGGALLLHAEQGLGDAIQFVRYARLAAPRCERLIIEAPRPLLALFRDAAAKGLLPGEVLAYGDTLPSFAAHAPFMSLPRIFATTPATVPAWPAYLAAPDQPRTELQLPPSRRRRIGLVWAGSPDNRIDRQRSMRPEFLHPLLSMDADFVNLQIGPGALGHDTDDFVFTIAGVVKDFADTATVIAQLDLVIGVDTAVLHLAGAMGKPAWVLLPAAPDYRWLEIGETTPWYPTFRLFRQPRRGDWGSVVTAVVDALAAL